MFFKNAREKSSALLDNPSPSLSITLCKERKEGNLSPLRIALKLQNEEGFRACVDENCPQTSFN